jgi:hypothetical protein
MEPVRFPRRLPNQEVPRVNPLVSGRLIGVVLEDLTKIASNLGQPEKSMADCSGSVKTINSV